MKKKRGLLGLVREDLSTLFVFSLSLCVSGGK